MSGDLIRMRGGESVDVRELRIIEPRWSATGERLDAIAEAQKSDDVLARRERGLRRPISDRAAGIGLSIAIGLLVAGGMWSPWFGGS